MRKIKRYALGAFVGIIVGKIVNYLMYDVDWSFLFDCLKEVIF
jgi:hypothetical protein